MMNVKREITVSKISPESKPKRRRLRSQYSNKNTQDKDTALDFSLNLLCIQGVNKSQQESLHKTSNKEERRDTNKSASCNDSSDGIESIETLPLHQKTVTKTPSFRNIDCNTTTNDCLKLHVYIPQHLKPQPAAIPRDSQQELQEEYNTKQEEQEQQEQPEAPSSILQEPIEKKAYNTKQAPPLDPNYLSSSSTRLIMGNQTNRMDKTKLDKKKHSNNKKAKIIIQSKPKDDIKKADNIFNSARRTENDIKRSAYRFLSKHCAFNDVEIVQDKKNASILKSRPPSNFSIFVDKAYDTSETDMIEPIMSPVLKSKQPPISYLPNECLCLIFLYINDLKTKSSISCVCNKWRQLMANKTNWKEASTSLDEFRRYMTSLKHTSYFGIPYLHKLFITAMQDERPRRTHELSNLTPFLRISSVKLEHVLYSDILIISQYLRNVIRCLECHAIRFEDKPRLTLSHFFDLPRLNLLVLEFSKNCSHISHPFSSRYHQVEAPMHLKVFALLNFYDVEEFAIGPITQDETSSYEFYEMEQKLLLKYSFFIKMRRLKSLTLSRCNSFTASVWRTCLLPCASRLHYLSLSGWFGGKESPVAYRMRIEAKNEMSANVLEEVELAQLDFFASLAAIKTICLDQFRCGKGLILGLEKLNLNYKIGGEMTRIDDHYLDSMLNQVKISFVL